MFWLDNEAKSYPAKRNLIALDIIIRANGRIMKLIEFVIRPKMATTLGFTNRLFNGRLDNETGQRRGISFQLFRYLVDRITGPYCTFIFTTYNNGIFARINVDMLSINDIVYY